MESRPGRRGADPHTTVRGNAQDLSARNAYRNLIIRGRMDPGVPVDVENEIPAIKIKAVGDFNPAVVFVGAEGVDPTRPIRRNLKNKVIIADKADFGAAREIAL